MISIIMRLIKNISIKYLILIPFIALTCLAVFLVGYIYHKNSEEAVNEVTAQLHREINTRIYKYIDNFLINPSRVNRFNADAILRGAVDYSDQKAMEKYFWEQIKLLKNITSISFGNMEGGVVNAGREGAGGSLYVIFTEDFRAGDFYKYATDELGNRTELLDSIPDFDARKRSWYSGAISADGDIWSDIYTLFTGQDMNITLSRAAYDGEGRFIGVLAVNFFLSHIDSFLESLDIGKTGESFIIEKTGYLVATSTGEKPFKNDIVSGEYTRINAADSDIDLIRDAAGHIFGAEGGIENFNLDEKFVFFANGKKVFGQATVYDESSGLDWIIITTIPEEDFMARVYENRETTLILIIIILLIVALISFFIAGKIVRPVYRLQEAALSLEKGEWDGAGAGGSFIKEFGRLTGSFNKMSLQLRENIEALNEEISEHHRTEEALQLSEARFRSLVTNVPGVIFRCSIDDSWTMHYISENIKNISGYPAAGFIGNKERTFSSIIHPDDRESLREEIDLSLSENTPYTLRYRINNADGNTCWVEENGQAVFDDYGEYIDGVITDITDIIQYEEKVNSLYEKLSEEVRKAEKIHKRIIPKTFPEIDHISIAAHYQPATSMGGDFYNVILSGNKLLIYLSDVMGHGIDGAMISFFVKEAIDSYVSLRPDEISPQKIISHLTRQYHRQNYPDEHLLCLFVVVMDLEKQEFSYSSAGFQTQPLIHSGDGSKKELESRGIFISNTVPLEMMNKEEISVPLKDKTTLLISTDGLAEISRNQEMFAGKYKEIFFDKCHLPPEIIVQAINKEFALFNNHSFIGDDDITFLVFQYDREEKKRYRFELASKYEEMELLYGKIIALTADYPGNDNLTTCLHELIVNAMEHGNHLDDRKKVTVELILRSDFILITVEDEGDGFEWSRKIDKPLSMESYTDRGRGISMTRMLAWNLFYNPKGNKAYLLLEQKA